MDRGLCYMSGEVVPHIEGEVTQVGGEIVRHLPVRDSVVVLGARITGAPELAGELEAVATERGTAEDAVQWTRHVPLIPETFFGRTANYTVEDTRPRGVIAFPYVRQDGMMIATNTDGHVEQLCAEYGVPLVWAEQAGEQFSLSAAIGELMAPQPGQIEG